MRNYKDIVRAASSDIASLEVITEGGADFIRMGEDGSYKIYCTNPDAEIPNYYQLAMKVSGNIELLDDEALICKASNADAIYKAGRSIIIVADDFEFPKSFEEAVAAKNRTKLEELTLVQEPYLAEGYYNGLPHFEANAVSNKNEESEFLVIWKITDLDAEDMANMVDDWDTPADIIAR